MSDSKQSPELAPWPEVDHSTFGEVETRPLNRFEKLAASWLARNWRLIPHVTHHDEAEVTLLEPLCKQLSTDSGAKVTPLAFLIKVAALALKKFPQFNASLDAAGANLTLKKYVHIGFAVDTPRGLLVPVLRDVDSKSVVDIAAEAAEVTALARDKGLPMDRMSGGCFTISSLGSIGGTAFTPIINAPEVAILGLARTYDKPVRDGDALAWQRSLPLSLSYDHRFINGANAARFCRFLDQCLGQPEALLD